VPVADHRPVTGVPVPLTRIVGRDAEVERAIGMLDADDTRLVTLLGPGGVGKTRLAIEVTGRMAGDFAHGAVFVALAPVRDPALVPAEVARTLGIQEAGDRPAAELVLSALRERHLLLVLDNVEHVAEVAAPWLGELLGACPRVTALVTSRVALQIDGERRLEVEPLELPDEVAVGNLASISRTAAVELFVQRASAARPGFALTERNVEVVAATCRALDGLPLAIELAAARIRVLSPADLLSRLSDRLAVLRSDRRDAPPRHRTMREALAWSHGLLDADQRRLFRRLTVFTGGFSLAAAEAVGGDGDGSRPVLDLLGDLVDHSLIRQAPDDVDGSRFVMLEVVREYGLDQLERVGETAVARDAHARWCIELASTAAEGIQGSEQLNWLGRLDIELDNIRGALAWLQERERIAEAQDLAGAVSIYLLIRAYYTEGRALYESLVTHPLGAAPTLGRAWSLCGLATFAFRQGDVPRAMEAFDESVATCRLLDAPRALALVLVRRAIMLHRVGRIDEARADCEESLELARVEAYDWGEAVARSILGLVLAQRGDRDEAQVQMQTSIDLCRTLGESWVRSISTANLALSVMMPRGQLDLAAIHIEEADRLMRLVGDRLNLATSFNLRAEIDRVRGDTAAAEEHLREALAIAREMDDPYGAGHALRLLGVLAAEAGDVERAVPLLREAIAHLSRMCGADEVGGCLDGLADVAIAVGDPATASRLLGAIDAALIAEGSTQSETTPGEHAARVAAVIAALGEDGYRAAWEAGYALSLDEAIAEALAWEPASREASPARRGPVAASGPASSLTPRELEVLQLIAEGLSNQQIADRLYLSRRTASSHASSILGKLGLASRTQAVAFALRNGLA
jgi:predicted ATPase/DNA-binding NarL/FixJ family response regulator